MLSKRDLGAEVAAQSAASSTAACKLKATPKHKVPKQTAPEPDIEQIRDFLDEAELDSVIFIKASDQLCDETVASKDTDKRSGQNSRQLPRRWNSHV